MLGKDGPREDTGHGRPPPSGLSPSVGSGPIARAQPRDRAAFGVSSDAGCGPCRGSARLAACLTSGVAPVAVVQAACTRAGWLNGGRPGLTIRFISARLPPLQSGSAVQANCARATRLCSLGPYRTHHSDLNLSSTPPGPCFCPASASKGLRHDGGPEGSAVLSNCTCSLQRDTGMVADWPCPSSSAEQTVGFSYSRPLPGAAVPCRIGSRCSRATCDA
jgi:hypothetical protein